MVPGQILRSPALDAGAVWTEQTQLTVVAGPGLLVGACVRAASLAVLVGPRAYCATVETGRELHDSLPSNWAPCFWIMPTITSVRSVR